MIFSHSNCLIDYCLVEQMVRGFHFRQTQQLDRVMPVAGKPIELPRQWHQAPVTVIYQGKNKRGEGMEVKE